jgi:hypothetical protein
MEKATTLHTKEGAVKAIEQYINLAFPKDRPPQLAVISPIYILFGCDSYHDKIKEYQKAIVAFLRAMAKPELSAALLSSMYQPHYDVFLELMEGAEEFCQEMSNEKLHALLELHNMDCGDPGELDFGAVTLKYKQLTAALNDDL